VLSHTLWFTTQSYDEQEFVVSRIGSELTRFQIEEITMNILETQSEKVALIVKPAEDRAGGPLDVLGAEILIKISSEDTGGAFAVFEGILPPLAGPPLHRHRDQDEWWYIVAGRYRFVVDGQTILAGPGDVVYAPRGSSHTFQNIGDETGTTITTVVPGGLDTFFEEVCAIAPRGTKPDPAVMLPLFEKYNLELLGPPLAAGAESPLR
jgi:mannose-6-phosphate isomerase-like protein (cupin superfamily)